jgi:gliding motility-associated-like protein
MKILASLFSKLTFCLIFCASMISFESRASHVPGGNIMYECVGPNQFLITLTLFEDCSTAFEGSGNQTVTISNTCGITGLTSVSLPNTVFQQEVSQLCDNQLSQSQCNGGNLPGVYMHQWQGIVTLPGNCTNWTFGYGTCCRNTSNNLSSGSSQNYYWQSTLNNTAAPCNNSPVITAPPIPYNCINQPVIYNFGVFEPDGNTLVYSLVPAMTGATGTVPYQAGLSGTNPINGITINSATGEINFTPTATGNYVVVVLIQEYDANGVLIGSIMQDFQFIVINCPGNSNPSPPASGISNFSGGVQTGPTAIQACEGDQICFNVTFTDAPTDIITLTSNLQNIFPTSTFNQISTSGSGATATICFTVLPGSNPFSVITVNAEDNACPVVGISSVSVSVTVISSTYAGADQIVCLGTGTQLQASGGSSFNWTLVSGDPITPTNFSCTNCPNPVANPSITSTYLVTSNLAGGCTNTDEITITVVPDFNYSLTQSSASTCLNSEINFNLVPNPAGNYTYNWTPATFLNNTSIASPTMLPTTPGNYSYTVTATSDQGCVKTETIQVSVASAYAPNITMTVDQTDIMCGETVNFTTQLGGGVPAMCGPSPNTTCQAPPSQQTIGNATGANTTTSWPAPFGNFYRTAKHQFLFTAAELQASGFVGGKITQIAWQVTQINGTANYNQYSVKMGCTNVTALTNTWQTGLTTVFNPQNITITTGWNTLTLTTAYEWDGISNLIVEVCFSNLGQNWTQNSATPWTTTAFNSSAFYYDDNSAACASNSAAWNSPSTNRPVTRFTTCPTIPDPNNFTFQWTPAAMMSNASIQNPTSAPMVSTTYQVIVTDNNGGCTDTAWVDVNVMCDTCLAPLPVLTHVTCHGGNNGNIVATPQGQNGPPFTIQLRNPTTNTLIQEVQNITTNTTFTGLLAGNYLIRSIDTTNCWADTIVTINQPPPMTIVASNDTLICIGGNAVIQATASGGNGGSYVYNWSGLASSTSTQIVSPTAPTTYVVQATDPQGCTSPTENIVVNMYPPILSTPGAHQTVCPGESALLSVTPNGGFGGTYYYSWTDVNGNVVSTTNPAIVTPTTAPMIYTVSITDNCETPATINTLTVNWHPLPQPAFIPNIFDGCYPVDVQFTNITDPNLVNTCLWNFGNGTTSTQCGTVNNVYTQPGNYSVSLQITSNEGCVGSTTISNLIEVYDYPMANFGFTPTVINVLEPTALFIDSSSTDVTFFQWNFGTNGSLGMSNLQHPQFTFPNTEPNTFPIELIVTNANGCRDTLTRTILMNGVYSFYVPTAFTPNNDGVNDYFFPQGEGIDPLNYDMYIFDRWGNLIFSTDDVNKQWDGTHLGEKAKSDVYVWRIVTKDVYKDIKYTYMGHITLVR